jgi:hypothetical protein
VDHIRVLSDAIPQIPPGNGRRSASDRRRTVRIAVAVVTAANNATTPENPATWSRLFPAEQANQADTGAGDTCCQQRDGDGRGGRRRPVRRANWVVACGIPPKAYANGVDGEGDNVNARFNAVLDERATSGTLDSGAAPIPWREFRQRRDRRGTTNPTTSRRTVFAQLRRVRLVADGGGLENRYGW